METSITPCNIKKLSGRIKNIGEIATDKNLIGAMLGLNPQHNHEYNYFNMDYLNSPEKQLEYLNYARFGGVFYNDNLFTKRTIYYKLSSTKNLGADEEFLYPYWTGYSRAENKQGEIKTPGTEIIRSDARIIYDIWDKKYSTQIYITTGVNNGGWGQKYIEYYTSPEYIQALRRVINKVEAANKNNNKPIIIQYDRNDGVFTINAAELSMWINVVIVAVDVVGTVIGFPAAGETLRPIANELLNWVKENDGKELNLDLAVETAIFAVSKTQPNLKEYTDKAKTIYQSYKNKDYGNIAKVLGADQKVANYLNINPQQVEKIINNYEIVQMAKNTGAKYSEVSNAITTINTTNTVSNIINNHDDLYDTLQVQKMTENKDMQNMLMSLGMNESTIPFQTRSKNSDIVASIIGNNKNELSANQKHQLLSITNNIPISNDSLKTVLIDSIINKAITDRKKVVDLPHSLDEGLKTCIADELAKNGITVNRTKTFKRNFFTLS